MRAISSREAEGSALRSLGNQACYPAHAMVPIPSDPRRVLEDETMALPSASSVTKPRWRGFLLHIRPLYYARPSVTPKYKDRRGDHT